MATPRAPWEYPEHLQYVVELISLGRNARIVGSYAYKNHATPSDADCYEVAKVDLDLVAASQYYAKRFQAIVRQVTVYDQVIFRDFKAGFNPNYQPDLAAIQTLAGRLDYIQQHDFNATEAAELTSLASDYFRFYQAIRAYYILHWTAAEVMAATKTSRGFTISLAEALLMPTIIKLDVISWVKDRFVSVEILYNLQYRDNTGRYRFIFPPPPYIPTLLDEITKFAQPDNFQPLKVLKRLWVLARSSGCDNLIAQIDPILQGPIASLNQISNDIDTIVFLLQNVQQLSRKGRKAINLIFTELLTMEGRIANSISPSGTTPYVSFKEIYDLFSNNPTGFDQPATVIAWLEQLEDSLGKVIQPAASQYYHLIESSQISCNSQDSRTVMDLFDLADTNQVVN